MKLIYLITLLALTGCASRIVVKNCNRTIDAQGLVTDEYVCVKQGLF